MTATDAFRTMCRRLSIEDHAVLLGALLYPVWDAPQLWVGNFSPLAAAPAYAVAANIIWSFLMISLAATLVGLTARRLPWRQGLALLAWAIVVEVGWKLLHEREDFFYKTVWAWSAWLTWPLAAFALALLARAVKPLLWHRRPPSANLLNNNSEEAPG